MCILSVWFEGGVVSHGLGVWEVESRDGVDGETEGVWSV
jgi:hypothetical protein